VTSLSARRPPTEPLHEQAGKRSSSLRPLDYYLHPGQRFVSAQSYVVTTILGSCVSVCLWDAVARVGAMNHFLLPFTTAADQVASRFGNLAVPDLISAIETAGAAHARLQAKVFGGARILEPFRQRENHLGAENVEVARQMLKAAGVPIVGEDIGGQKARKLIFQTDNGAAWIKRI
jgi:chemotaxis protein CheD